MTGQDRTHRRYSPSQAERFFGCEGSNALLMNVPARPSSVYAVEGTKAHDVLEAALTNRVRDAKDAHLDYSTLFFEELDDGKNDFYMSIQIALDHIYSILDAHPDATMWVERFVDPPLPAAPGEAGGYCDVAVFVPSLRALFVIDYKHGAGIAKAVKGNKQALQYASGFLYEDNAVVDVADVDFVVLTILQPRAFHEDGIVREEEVTPYELWEYLEELNDKVTMCEAPDAPLNPGEDQCRFCDANTVCPALETKALQVANSAFQQINQFQSAELPVVSQLDMDRLGRIRFHAPMLRKWLDTVDKHCDELARGGHAVPGAKLVETQASRKYYGTDEDVARKLAAMMSEGNPEAAMDAYEAVMKAHPILRKLYTHKLITITSAEKQVVEAYKRRVGRGKKKKAAEEGKQAFAFLTLKQSSGNLVLVNEDDKRPPVNKARTTFGQIQSALAPPLLISQE